MSINQISIFLENKTGQLSEITTLLADNGIDLRAISIAETTDYGVLRIIANDSEQATSVLLANGNILSLTPVTVVAVDDQPGGLAKLLTVLAQGGVAVEYMYSFFTSKDNKAYMVFRTADDAKTVALLESSGMKIVSGPELGLK